MVVLSSFDPESVPGLGGLSRGQSKIDLMPAKPAENRTLDQMVAEAKVGAAQVLREEP